ncbi:MAG: CBS domain-containing protein [Clostridia bacterium]|nr:CBS domain-containing protein [Clostridia bacterium]
MKVRDCMSNNVIWLTPDATIGECAKIMDEHHIGSIPICNPNQNVVGVVTDRDILLRAIINNKDINNTKISEIMTTGVYCCEANTDIEHATTVMSENQVRRLPVIDQNKIVGILTLTDLSRSEQVSDFKFATTYDNICNYNRKNNQ